MSIVVLKDRIPTLPKLDEVRERQDKLRVEQTQLDQLRKEAEILQNQIKFKREQPIMLAALQEEEKNRELKALIQEQKSIYAKLMADRQQTEKQSRKQAIELVN